MDKIDKALRAFNLILTEYAGIEYIMTEDRRKSFVKLCDEAREQVKTCDKPAVIKSAFKCDDVELQPIECEKWRGCFDCPHYKAVL